MSLELLQVAEAVAREKDIDREMIVEAMEQAIQMGARRKYGMDLDIIASVDRMDGSITLKRRWEVVSKVVEPIDEDEYRRAQRENREPKMKPAVDKEGKPVSKNEFQMLLSEAQKVKKDAALGDFIEEELPPFDFGRIAAQAAKQVIFQKVRDAERVKEFEEYESRVGEIMSGIVKRVDYNGILIDLGRAEAILPRNEIIPKETYRQGDRVRGYIYDVRREQRGPQIFISRTHPKLLEKLFAQAVPEIASGTIEIIGAARDPGFRAKIAVKSYDHNIDPVGACVGIRGVRVQEVVNELQGERVDIIEYTPDPAAFLIKAIAPATVTKVVVDEAEGRMEVIVPEDNLSLAIGRRGQNVRLASMLTGWSIDVMTESESSEKQAAQFDTLSKMFIEGLDVDDTLARLLIAEGFNSIEEMVMISAEEMGGIEGLDEAIATELQNRANTWLASQRKQIEKIGVSDELAALEGIRTEILLELGKNKIVTLDDLGDLATDELMEMLPKGLMTDAQAERLIMQARQHWFADEDGSQTTANAS